jgi:hypothetical protein
MTSGVLAFQNPHPSDLKCFCLCSLSALYY